MTGIRVAALLLVAALTMGAQDEPMWKLELRLQLQDDKQCDMLYTTNDRQMELGGETTLSGRAHCQDGRAFDYSRLKKKDGFKFADCEVQTC